VLSVAGEGVAVGLGHWFNELGLRVSFGDAFLRFLLVGFVFPAALTRIRRPAAARKVAGFANHPFHSLFPSVRSEGDSDQHGLLACLAGNFYQTLQINGNDESKRTRAHLVLLFGCGSSRLYFLSRIPVL
jgi:hypothetical protein